MRLLRPADYRRVPWRNGRGETLEIAQAEARLATGAPVWRLSRAAVTEDGPFSAFPEYVRWLTVAQGAGMRLTGPGFDATVRLGETVRFPGAPGPHGALLDGPVQDVNLMAAPEVTGAGAEPLTLAAPARLRKRAGGALLIHAARGAARLTGSSAATLGEGETLWLEAEDPAGAYRLTRDGDRPDGALMVVARV